jgi:uncharacterized protein (DUF2249 family)
VSLASPARPIRPGDRVSDVLARDESLVDVFVRHSTHFMKLRNRAMRKVMGRLVSVEDAARIAGVAVDTLVCDLNAALGIGTPRTSTAVHEVTPAQNEPPSARTRPRDARVVDVDVREELRQGREPFARIMSAVGALADGEVLHVRAIFHPAPLLTVLARRGFVSESEQHAPDDWSVWFWRDSVPGAALPSHTRENSIASPCSRDSAIVSPRSREATVGASVISDENTVWLDVRGLQPPEPLVQTLTALASLPDGHQLIQLNERIPQLLLPMLAERGFACELDDSRVDRVLLRIWRPA